MPLSEKTLPPPISFPEWMSSILGLVPGWYLVQQAIKSVSKEVQDLGYGSYTIYNLTLNSQVTSYT